VSKCIARIIRKLIDLFQASAKKRIAEISLERYMCNKTSISVMLIQELLFMLTDLLVLSLKYNIIYTHTHTHTYTLYINNYIYIYMHTVSYNFPGNLKSFLIFS